MLLLVLNNVCAMDTERIEIRIKTPGGDMDTSVDCPSLLSFNDLLVKLSQYMLISRVISLHLMERTKNMF